jgi:energy-coupling factor transporter ATP-binding protein EcfA2
MWPADIANIQPIKWRLKNVLPATGLAAIYGPSGSGKSFLTVDLGRAISHGNPWFGIKTYQATVIYVVLEGEAGIWNRVQALEKAHGPLPPKGFGVITQSFEIVKPQDLVDLSAVIPSGSVVFIDTLNRAAPTADENSSRDMGEILEAAKMLYRVTNSLVVLVHHTGKDASRGMRGHSSLFAAVDGAREVTRDAAGNRSWAVAKAKDGEDNKTANFRLKRHVLDQDAEGEDIVSCSVEPDTSQVFVTREPSGAKQKLALAAIRRALVSATNAGKCTAGTGTPCLSVTEAIAVVAAELTTDPANKRNYKAKGLIDSLLGGGFVCSGLDAQGDGWLWKL